MDETVELKIIGLYNHVLAQFPLTTTETELDYYHHTVNVGVATRYSERFKTQDLWKLGNFRKILEMFVFVGDHPVSNSKGKFNICAKNLQKISSRTFHRKSYFTFTKICLKSFVEDCRREKFITKYSLTCKSISFPWIFISIFI